MISGSWMEKVEFGVCVRMRWETWSQKWPRVVKMLDEVGAASLRSAEIAGEFRVTVGESCSGLRTFTVPDGEAAIEGRFRD